MGFFEKIKQGLTKTRKAMASTLGGVFAGFSGVDEDFYDDLMDALILSDMGAKCAGEAIEQLRAHVEEQGYAFFELSAAAHMGTRELVLECARRLKELPPILRFEADYVPPEPKVDTSGELTIEHFDDMWLVEGPWLQRLVATVNFSDYESRMFFDRMLRNSGVYDRLEERGINEGDTVSIFDLEFEYMR